MQGLLCCWGEENMPTGVVQREGGVAVDRTGGAVEG